VKFGKSDILCSTVRSSDAEGIHVPSFRNASHATSHRSPGPNNTHRTSPSPKLCSSRKPGKHPTILSIAHQCNRGEALDDTSFPQRRCAPWRMRKALLGASLSPRLSRYSPGPASHPVPVITKGKRRSKRQHAVTAKGNYTKMAAAHHSAPSCFAASLL